MSKSEAKARGETVSEPSLPRPGHGHQRSRSEDRGPADQHPSWLKEWRSLRAGCGGRDAETSRYPALELQGKIASTPAVTLAGLQAQAELISELAWNDVVAATARQLIAGLRRLQRPGTG